MKYVYYKNVSTGSIFSFHKAPDCIEDELNEKIAKYNEENEQNCNAVVIEVEKGSFMDFLIHKANERVQINKGILADLDNALSEASAIVDNLRYGAQ